MKLITNTKELRQSIVGIRNVQERLPKAFDSAMRRVMQGVRTEAARAVRQRYYVRHGDVLATIKVTKADRPGLAYLLRSRGPSIPLIRFRTTPARPQPKKARVLRAAVKKAGGKKPIPGAFVAQMQSGHTGVFRRVGKKRLPLDQLYGPAIPVMMSEQSVTEHLQEQAHKRMVTRLDHEVNRVLGRLKTK